jgi:hypothetical protein
VEGPAARLTLDLGTFAPLGAGRVMGRSGTMFVRDFIEIPRPFEAVAPRLVREAAWLDPIARDALAEAVATLGELRPDQPVDLGLAPLTVRCARGPARLRADALVMPLRWDTNVPAALVPPVDGDLEVVPLGGERSQISLDASARVAPGAGNGITRRVVETSLRVFLRRLAATLQQPV